MRREASRFGEPKRRRGRSLLVKPSGEQAFVPEEGHPWLFTASPVMAEYAKHLGVPIQVHLPPGRFSRPGASALHVHLFALPSHALSLPLHPFWIQLRPRSRLEPLPSAFGHPLAEGTRLIVGPPAERGRGRLLADAEGRCLVEVLETNLYVLFDLTRQEAGLSRLLLRKGLDLGLGIMLESLCNLSPYSLGCLKVVLEHLSRQTALEELRQVEGPGRLAGDVLLSQRIEAAERALRAYSVFLDAEERCLSHYLERLQALRRLQEDEERYASGFRQLLQLPEVREVRIKKGAISFFTDTIHVEYQKKCYRLGRFRIDVAFDGSVFIKNLTDPYETYDHPHVSEGRPCLGNIQEWVRRLVEDYQFGAAAQVLIEYLKTVTPGDWRKSITFWKEVPRDEPPRGSAPSDPHHTLGL